MMDHAHACSQLPDQQGYQNFSMQQLAKAISDEALHYARAGRFGFNKDMNALDSVASGHAQGDKADTLLRSTHEVMKRFYEPW